MADLRSVLHRLKDGDSVWFEGILYERRGDHYFKKNVGEQPANIVVQLPIGEESRQKTPRNKPAESLDRPDTNSQLSGLKDAQRSYEHKEALNNRGPRDAPHDGRDPKISSSAQLSRRDEHEYRERSHARGSKETFYDERDARIPTSEQQDRQDRHAKDSRQNENRPIQGKNNEQLPPRPQIERLPTGTTDASKTTPTYHPLTRTMSSDQYTGETSRKPRPSVSGARPTALASHESRHDEKYFGSRRERYEENVGSRRNVDDDEKPDIRFAPDNKPNYDSRHHLNDEEDFNPRHDRNDEPPKPHRYGGKGENPEIRRLHTNDEIPASRRQDDDEDDDYYEEEDWNQRYQRRGTTASQRNPNLSSRDHLPGSRHSQEEQAMQGERTVMKEPVFKVLNGIAKYFIYISYNDFIGRVDFVMENTEILSANLSRFLEEAVWQQSQGKSDLAKKCIQSLVLLNMWRDIKLRDVPKHTESLQEETSQEREAYRKLYAQVKQTVDTQVAEKAEKAKRANAQTTPPIPKTAPQQQPLSSDLRHSSNKNRTNPPTGTQALIPIRTQKNVDAQSDTIPAEIEVDEVTRKVMDKISKIATKSPPIPSVSPEKLTGEDAKAFKALSLQYQVPLNGRIFFQQGRVFSILWSQPAGQSHRPNSSNTIDEPTPAENEKLPYNVTYGLHRERVFSQIRRMVVIRNREGYCWCVSIGTYGGRGLKKGGLKQSEIDAHAIIYDSTSKAQRLDGEPTTTKRAIAVNLEPGQILNTASRLHFAKPFTIEWNTKVMNVGMVANECLPSLVNDVAQELLGDLKQRQKA